MTELERPPFPTHWDSTMVSAFKTCHRMGYHEFLQKIALFGTSPHLHAGGVLARGFEVARISHWGPERCSPEQSITNAVREMMKMYGDYIPPDWGNASNKSLNNCIYALLSYFDNYGWDTDPVQPLIKDDGFPAVEFRFSEVLDINHPVTGEPLVYCGRFDMFGVSREYGGALYVVDEKTSATLGASWSKQWNLRSQFIGYTWAARRNDFPVLGAIVRGVGMLKTQITHLDAILQIPRWKVDQWHELTCIHLEKVIAAWKAGYWLQQYDDSCNAYGGCDFKALCDTNNPQAYIGDYQSRVWDPLAQDPTHTGEQKQHQGFASIAEEERT